MLPQPELRHFDLPRDADPAAVLHTPRGQLGWRRLAFAGPALAMPLAGAWLAERLTASSGDPMRWPLLALLFVNLLYLTLTGWPGVLGALARVFGHRQTHAAQPNGTSRTAILFPVYNEDPHAVLAAVAVMARDIADAGLPNVAIFVLSDTQDAVLAAAELAAYRQMTPTAGVPTHYRRREANARRKVGNIAEFCAEWGGQYDYMLVLDADSLMSAASVGTLIGLMDANPRTGLVQTVPYATGRETLFARIQQFSARLYTPLLVEGLAFWQQGDANYWGHNAIIRIAPFVEHCDLPVLPGSEPFGGEILCHDVVEAALMRRGGWDVWMAPTLGESYEALPANMVDFAQRERRWCQGNLQHLGVLPMAELKLTGRYHLGLGVLNYMSGPLLLAMVAAVLGDGLAGGTAVRTLFGGTGWPAAALAVLTLFLLYGAKLCSLAVVLCDDDAVKSFGGRPRLLASAALEQAAAMITAPVLLSFYTRFIVMMLLGRSVKWDAQPRDDRGVSWAEAMRRMRYPAVLGAAWLAGAVAVGGATLAWSATLLPGMLLAAPFAVWTSRRELGLAAKRLGLFLTADEVAPSAILRSVQRVLAGSAGAVTAPRPKPHLVYLRTAPELEGE